MTQNATQAKKSRSFTVGASFRLSSYYSLNKAKTHFLSHLGEKKRRNMARPGFEPTISRSEVDLANHYSIGHLLELWQIYFCYIRTLWWDKKWVFTCSNFCECTVRVKLELSDFSKVLRPLRSKMHFNFFCISLPKIINGHYSRVPNNCATATKNYFVTKIDLAYCTEVCFASLFSDGFITVIVVNPLERKLEKCTSVHCFV